MGWVCDELPKEKPRHLLGISEPDDLFTAIAAGADTFDCVAPTRLGRRGGVYTLNGRMNLTGARFKRDFTPVDAEVGGYVSENFTRAYIHHLLKAKEFLAGTLCTMHNLHFMIRLVDNIREAMKEGRFEEYRAEFMSRYYGLIGQTGWCRRTSSTGCGSFPLGRGLQKPRTGARHRGNRRVKLRKRIDEVAVPQIP